VHGGLRIAGHHGFDRPFLDFFGYVDHEGTSCADALTGAQQVTADDIASSPMFREPARETLLKSGIHVSHATIAPARICQPNGRITLQTGTAANKTRPPRWRLLTASPPCTAIRRHPAFAWGHVVRPIDMTWRWRVRPG
jgi:hypothetical protein